MSQNSEKESRLYERSVVFGEEIVRFCQTIRQDTITQPLVSQLVRSGTSIGANLSEAINASSKRDFRNKIFIAKKEAQESIHWLRMLVAAIPNLQERASDLSDECRQFVLILQKTVSTIDKK